MESFNATTTTTTTARVQVGIHLKESCNDNYKVRACIILLVVN